MQPDWKLPQGVRAICTTRAGGVSLPPYDSFNLGDHVRDDPQAVATNRQRLQQQIQAHAVFLQQVHGKEVVELTADTPDATVADACWTRRSGLACTILVADCLPLLLTDRQGQVVAAAHAGWRGLAGGVVVQTVHALCRHGGVDAADLMAWLGPCIGPEAFAVGAEVREAFVIAQATWARFFKPHPQHAGKWLADLAGMARAQLQDLGVRDLSGNDSTRAWCTVSQASQFFSYRRDGVTGRFAAAIWRQV